MANVSTAGFRAEEISFEELLSNAGQAPVSFVSQGATHLSVRAGELVKTDNPLDVAVRGRSWLAFQSAEGTSYTRDGRMMMSPDGNLTTITGKPVLDASGSPLQLDPRGPSPVMASDGTVTQGSRRVGAIGLFRMDPAAKLIRGEGSAVIPDIPPTPELEFATNGIIQGYVERSNVNAISEMSRLIAIQRSFEAVSTTIQDMETAQQDAIRTLGSS
jgi:flagellar basal-body rod protein FlgF